MKDKLLQEIASADLSQYSGALAGVSLQESERKQVTEAFEAAVKGVAMKVTESIVDTLEYDVERYSEYIQEETATKAEEYGEYLKEEYAEKIDTYLNHISETWLQENKIAVTSGIKESMFDSLMGEFKTMFVEHNIYVPEDKVDVVEELEEQLTEYSAELDKSLRSNKSLSERVNELEKASVIVERTANMAQSQRERVETLSENLDFSDSDFQRQLDTIISMVSIGESAKPVAKQSLNTSMQQPKQLKETRGLNVSSYVKAAQRL